MLKTIKAAFLYWLPAFLWMAVIFTLSSIPGQDIPKVDVPNIDKVVHFVEYLILGFLLIRALLKSGLNINLAKITILAIIIATLYAASDEWHQRFISGRTCDAIDFFWDFIGLNIGILLYNLNERGHNCR